MAGEIDGIFRSKSLSSQSQARKSFKMCLRLPRREGRMCASCPFWIQRQRKDLSSADPKSDRCWCQRYRAWVLRLHRLFLLGQYGLHAPAVKTVQTSGQYAGKMPAFQCKEKEGDVASPSLFEQQNFHRAKEAFSCTPTACGLSHCRPQGNLCL